MPRTKPRATHPQPDPERQPTISIYQNADYVASILQQLAHQPLVTDETREGSRDQTDGRETSLSVEGAGGASVKAPFAGSVDLELTGGAGSNKSKAIVTGDRTTQTFIYSQAYYLDVVRMMLERAKLLKRVNSFAEARSLKAGDFVEYRASFRSSEISAIFDVLTPDLIAEVARWQMRSSAIKKADGISDQQERADYIDSQGLQADARADLVRTIAGGVLADFRSDRTRECYGTLVGAAGKVTVVTICDRDHFVAKDEDLILDGDFTVLGKVASKVKDDVSTLERNKILRRIKPSAFDWIAGQLQQAGQAQIGNMGKVSDFVDITLASRVEGPSFGVVPIAIYL